MIDNDPPHGHEVKHCALCAGEKPHLVIRHSIDGKGRPFTVTDTACVTCRERMDASAEKLGKYLGRILG